MHCRDEAPFDICVHPLDPNSEEGIIFNPDEFDWGRVHYLILAHTHNFTYFKNGFFAKLTNVIFIDISYTILDSIDFNEFVNNSELKYLKFAFSSISEIKPIKNSTITNIIELWMPYNDLTDISELCKFKKLKKLDLSGSKNLVFNTSMFNCWKHLEKLYLNDTNFNNLGMEYLVVTRSYKRVIYSLSNNNFEKLCVEHFPGSPYLTQLDLLNNQSISMSLEERNKIDEFVTSERYNICDESKLEMIKKLSIEVVEEPAQSVQISKQQNEDTQHPSVVENTTEHSSTQNQQSKASKARMTSVNIMIVTILLIFFSNIGFFSCMICTKFTGSN
jgi:Leucine-rich repeat (LRR) protein